MLRIPLQPHPRAGWVNLGAEPLVLRGHATFDAIAQMARSKARVRRQCHWLASRQGFILLGASQVRRDRGRYRLIGRVFVETENRAGVNLETDVAAIGGQAEVDTGDRQTQVRRK